MFGPQYNCSPPKLARLFYYIQQLQYCLHSVWPSRLKTLVMYYNSVGKAYFGGLRQFHVSWIGPQQGGEQLETIITARITYIARTWNGLKTHPWTFVLTEKNKYYLGYFFRQNITVSTCFHPQCSEYSSSRSVSF